jgi:DNA-binding MarR family transcriptional regulator
MDYTLIKELISLAETFENQDSGSYPENVDGFKQWVVDQSKKEKVSIAEPTWEGKEKGRSPESVISTLLVHMNRYAKSYSKSAIHQSDFSTQEEFIYLITLKSSGAMTKMQLIKKNVQDKPSGMQIINRLIQQGWIKQQVSTTDKRSRILDITKKGLKALESQMDNIRQATKIVAGDLTYAEKIELIRLLGKLDHFHHGIFSRNLGSDELLHIALTEHLPALT